MEELISRWGVWARKGQDQVFLREVIYPRFERDLLVHSDLFRYGEERCLPFPVPRKPGEFVGSVVNPDRDELTDDQVRENIARFTGLEMQQLPRPSRRPWIKSVILTKQWFRSHFSQSVGS